MTDTNVAIRLKHFIESNGLSYSQFADECGIPRPSLSQLITGRNKKISDVLVGQIHNAYPSLNILWLLFNEGEMYVKNSNQETEDNSDNQNHFSDDLSGNTSLFSDDPSFRNINDTIHGDKSSFKSTVSPTNRQRPDNYSKETPLSPFQLSAKSPDNELVEANIQIRRLKSELDKLHRNPRRVTQIMVYYDDYTFETFVPKAN